MSFLFSIIQFSAIQFISMENFLEIILENSYTCVYGTVHAARCDNSLVLLLLSHST